MNLAIKKFCADFSENIISARKLLICCECHEEQLYFLNQIVQCFDNARLFLNIGRCLPQVLFTSDLRSSRPASEFKKSKEKSKPVAKAIKKEAEEKMEEEEEKKECKGGFPAAEIKKEVFDERPNRKRKTTNVSLEKRIKSKPR